MNFDLARALRAIRPQRVRNPLLRRNDHELEWALDELPIGVPLLLDTTVYVDVLSGSAPDEVEQLLVSRICNHSTVALAELTHGFGRLDPHHPDTKTSLRVLAETISDIPRHRLYEPEADVWGAAGMLAGATLRLSGASPRNQISATLNDAMLYLQARKLGCAFVTANVSDFDFLNQLVPDGRVLFYKRS